MIRNLLLGHRASPLDADPAALTFSFTAEGEGERFSAVLVGGDGSRQEMTVLPEEAIGFSFPQPGRAGTVYRMTVEGAESNAAMSFETAVPFDAPFLTTGEDREHPRFLRRFLLRMRPVRARLRITGLGLYRAYLNGERVGELFLTPGFNDYDAYLRYQTYDVTPLLREGENLLEVFLGDGWYRGRIGFDGHPGRVWGERYLLALTLAADLPDGEVFRLDSDRGFTVTNSPVTFSSIYDGENLDLSRLYGQETPAVLAQFAAPVVAFGVGVTVQKELPPRLLRSPSGAQILDFGQNMAGIVRFRLRAAEGKTVRLRFAELLSDGELCRDNLRSARAEFCVISGGEEKTVEPMFTYFGFRYVEVTGQEVDPDDFRALALSSALRPTLEMKTGDERINRLLSNTRWGQLSNFVDLPTDCPQRDERLGWTADAQAFAGTANLFADCYPFYKKYLRDLRYEQTRYYSGELPAYAPSLKGDAQPGGAIWSDAAAVIPWQVFLTSGDLFFLGAEYPLMRDYAEYLICEDRRSGGQGLLREGFTFGDWLAQDTGDDQALKGATDDTLIRTASFLRVLDTVAAAAEKLGKQDDAQRFRQKHAEVLSAFRREFFTPLGRLAVDTQTAHILSLAFGLSPDPGRTARDLAYRLRRDAWKIRTGFAGTPLALPTLFDAGLGSEAYRILFSEECPGWLYAVRLGATTVWERWNSLLPNGHLSGVTMNSLNHYANGSVCEAIITRIGGLRLKEPGWREAEIHPYPDARIRSCRLGYDSASGRYQVAWEILPGGDFSLSVSVPDGCSATVVLPAHPYGQIECVRGEREYRYHPTVDYLHPFSMYSPMADLLSPLTEPAFAFCPELLAIGRQMPSDSPYELSQKHYLHIPEKTVQMLHLRLKEITL